MGSKTRRTLAAICMVFSMLLVFTDSAFAANIIENEEEQSDYTSRVLATREAVFSGDTATLSDADDLYCLVQVCYAKYQGDGPFAITQGEIVKKGVRTPIYVITISGTDSSVENQTTDFDTDLESGFEKDNQYVRNVVAAIEKDVPTGSNLFVTGHSLGGMIAQQVVSDSQMKDDYNIWNTVTYGSPLINGFDREGTVKRLGDTSDYIPYMSVSTFYNIFWQSFGLNKEDGGYGGWGNWKQAHVESYARHDVWGNYDVTGVKKGGTSLVLDYSTTTFYHSPKN